MPHIEELVDPRNVVNHETNEAQLKSIALLTGILA
jgi:hypothetical protein